MRQAINVILWMCLTVFCLLVEGGRAHACSYPMPFYGFSTSTWDRIDTIPINGSWAVHGSYGSWTDADAPEPVFNVEVYNEEGKPIGGKTTFIPYGKKHIYQGPDVGYSQSAFVIWTPDQDLELHTVYDAHILRYEEGEALNQDYYSGTGSFSTTSAFESTEPHAGLAPVRSQAEYVDIPAYNQTCEQRRPCRDGCGCNTYRWSTRYYRFPIIELDFTQPDDPSTGQFYHVIEDVNGKIRDIVWTESAKPNTTFELDHGDEAPIELTIRTFALGESEPVATHEYTLTEEDLPPLESTDFIAEKAPKKCRNRSVTTVHTDGYKAPSQGCASATSHPMGIAWILFTFCLLLRLRLASNSDRVYAAKQCKN